MTAAQIEILGILLGTVALFLWGRWRHDLVALASLLACVVLGLVDTEQAFLGFGHPAVVTVASVLVLSRGLQDTGAVDRLARLLLPRDVGMFAGIAALTGLGAALSAFMNNVGAMALLLPIGLQLAERLELPPSRVLMPLAFGTILGGMTTLIGTPPNLIVSGFRAEQTGEAFAMFDFTPVGGAVALSGVAFLVLLGWRLVPARQAAAESFETGAYLVEASVGRDGPSVGRTIRQAEALLEEAGAQIVGLVRDQTRLHAPLPRRRILPGDILVIEAEPDDLADALSALGLTLGDGEDKEDGKDNGKEGGRKGAKDDDEDGAKAKDGAKAEDGAEGKGDAGREDKDAARDEGRAEGGSNKATAKAKGKAKDGTKVRREDALGNGDRDRSTGEAGKAAEAGKPGKAAEAGQPGNGGDAARETDETPTGESRESGEPLTLQEFVVRPESELKGRSSAGVEMPSRYGINLLAVSRQGQREIRRLRTMRFRQGDLLLLQGSPEALAGFAREYRLVPLASRDIRLPQPRKAVLAALVMALAIAVAALGVLPAAAAFAGGVLAMALLDIVPVRQLYHGVDWPVVVLLGALIPVAGAMSSTGTADVIAGALLDRVAGGSAVLALGLILVVTMTLSDFMNNAATAAVMCPIAISGAERLGVAADPLLMAVAIGGSCAFLTPIGHQNNTLILGPAGLSFGDYWRLGLPMELLVVAISIPTLLYVWPLN